MEIPFFLKKKGNKCNVSEKKKTPRENFTRVLRKVGERGQNLSEKVGEDNEKVTSYN